jgi:hypothetical protein
MTDSEVFDLVCEELERSTSLDRLEARGTMRITLKQAGLEPRSVSAQQMSVAVEKLLPGELVSRGVGESDGVCREICAALARMTTAPSVSTPEAVFERLGG